MYKYQIYKKSFTGLDELLTECSDRKEIPFELELLGFKDCKTKLDENGTLIYYKGKSNQLYVKYVKY